MPIAVGILAASQQIWFEKLKGGLFIGELSLDGTLRPTKGVVAGASGAGAGIRTRFVPAENAGEAALMPGIEVIPVGELSAVGQPSDRPAADSRL